MIEWWGPILIEYYAGSEGNGVTVSTSQQWLTHRGTVGRAVVGKVKILDEEGEERPVGEIGTVYFADAPAFTYHNDPEKTKKAYNDKKQRSRHVGTHCKSNSIRAHGGGMDSGAHGAVGRTDSSGNRFPRAGQVDYPRHWSSQDSWSLRPRAWLSRLWRRVKTDSSGGRKSDSQHRRSCRPRTLASGR